MKYTKKYPIHPLPDKQFSGASIFAQGGQLPEDDKPKSKTYTNKAEYDKALRAYNDSLNLYNFGVNSAAKLYKSTIDEYTEYTNNPDKKASDSLHNLTKLNTVKPKPIKTFTRNIVEGDRSAEAQASWFKKPVVKPEYNNPDALDASRPKPQRKIRDVIKTTLEQDYWNTDKDVLSFRKAYKTKFGEEPIRDASVAKYDYDAAYKAGARPSLNTEDGLYHWDSRFKADDHPNRYVDGVDTKTGKQLPIAKGTMESEPKPINELMMPSGTKMSKEEFLKTYSENAWLKATGQKFAFGGFKYFNGGSFYDSSNINTSKPQVNKDGTTTTTTNSAYPSSGGYNPSVGSYVGALSSAVPGYMNAYNLEKSGNRPEAVKQATQTSVDTTASMIPVVGQIYGAARGVGNYASMIGEGDNKVVTSKDGKQATSSSNDASQVFGDTLSGAFNPSQNLSRAGEHISDSSDPNGWWKAGLDMLLPTVGNAITQKIDRDEENKLAQQYYMSNADVLKNQGSQNFSAFGGYKNKFPYGGNMQSEVTGQSYLKDQVSDFTSNKFSKHEHGGVMVDSQNEVEAGEIVYKDYVFSDRLKDSNGKSFAERAKKLISQIK